MLTVFDNEWPASHFSFALSSKQFPKHLVCVSLCSWEGLWQRGDRLPETPHGGGCESTEGSQVSVSSQGRPPTPPGPAAPWLHPESLQPHGSTSLAKPRSPTCYTWASCSHLTPRGRDPALLLALLCLLEACPHPVGWPFSLTTALSLLLSVFGTHFLPLVPFGDSQGPHLDPLPAIPVTSQITASTPHLLPVSPLLNSSTWMAPCHL